MMSRDDDIEWNWIPCVATICIDLPYISYTRNAPSGGTRNSKKRWPIPKKEWDTPTTP
jgi:hypothetical protein